MAYTVDQITQNIVNQLRLLDPSVSAEVGTPERKLIEATAEMIASSQVDFTVLNQQHDLDTMAGGRLDAYLSIFNFGRQRATPAYGTVTFLRNTENTSAIVIPLGTQVQALIDDDLFPSLTYVTLQTVVLEAGQLSVSAPAQCTVAGSIGNIDAGKIVGFGGLRSINGITTVTNYQPMSGGTDAETDAQYKTRFQNTFLRNISGTTDMFLALAVAQNGVSKANVVGPMSRYQEYVQVPTARDNALKTQAGGVDDNGILFLHKRTSAQSTVPYSKYTWPGNHYLTDSTLDPATAVFYRHEVDYVFNSPPIDATAAGTSEQQTITRTSTGGTFTLTFRDSTTAAISGAATLTAAEIETALEALPTVGLDNVAVTGSAGGPFTVTFQNELRYSNVPMLVEDETNLTGGTITIAQSVAGVESTQADDTPVTSPNVTFLNPYDADDNPTGNPSLPLDGVALLEHAYMSVNSRNDVTFGILNCVDVFVDGQNLASASSTEIVPGIAHDLQDSFTLLWTFQDPTGPPIVINFRRALDGAPCTVGHRIQPLYWQPVVDLPDSIQVGAETYYKANFYNTANSTYYNQYDVNTDTYSYPAHYATATEVNSYHGTVRSRNGIEWFLTGNNYLAGQLPEDGETYTGVYIDQQEGAAFTVDGYLYDQNIADLQAITEKNKQVTQDVLVHKAKYRYFRPIITIMYTLGATRTTVNASIAAALSNFFRNQYFGSTVQLSDILQVVHNTPGVDNVRWTNNDDGLNKLEEVGPNGSSLPGGPYYITTDFYLQDNELPASPTANATEITVRAQNTWSV